MQFPSKRKTSRLYILVVHVISSTFVTGQNPETELRLRKDLFSKHSNYIRPVANISEPVEIIGELQLYALNSFDTINGILMTQCSLELTWYDQFLFWDPAEYDNISMIYVSSNEIWRPIVIVCNAVVEQSIDKEVSYLVLNSDGRVVLWYQEIIRTFCTIDAHGYPFDKQRCHILICVAIHKAQHTVIRQLRYRKARFFKNYQWDVDMEGIRKSEDNSGRSLTRATILLNRRIKINTLALLVPSGIFTVISIFVSLLPAESGEKVSLSTTLFLSIIVYLVEIDKVTPKNSESMPLITVYLLTLATLSGFNTIGAIIECRVYIMQEKKCDMKKRSVPSDDIVTAEIPKRETDRIKDIEQAPSIRNSDNNVSDDVPKTNYATMLAKENQQKSDVSYKRHRPRHQKLSRIFFGINVTYIITSIITICLTNAFLEED